MKKYGYKGFNIKPDGTIYCSPYGGYQEYKINEIVEIDGELELCKNGVHFCWNLNDVYDFYNFNYDNVIVGKVEILGKTINDEDNKKSCTNKIKLVRLYPTKKQLMKESNSGANNTGYCNTGDRNTGDWNTGDRNTGDRNTGDRNTGNRNTGDRNTGDRNTGYCNTGDRNTGDRNTGYCNTGYCNTGNRNTGYWNTGYCNTGYCNTGNCNTGNRNTGYWNTGDWNSCNYSNGLFNTISPKISLFNKPTIYSMEEFKETKWYNSLTNGNFNLTKWIPYTEEEMKNDESKRKTGGRTVAVDYKDACKEWWNSLNKFDKDIIKTIPNFDADIFEEITGIKL